MMNLVAMNLQWVVINRDNEMTPSTIINSLSLSHPKTAIITTYNTVRQRSIKEEFAFYLDRVQGGQPFQEFWSSYEMKRPRLAALVRAYNIRSVSSVASESLFSIAGYVQRKRRSSLASNTLYYSMVLRDQDILPTLIL
ncbi:unnamed protein product [Rotaria socialis]|uniref:HAT C-terminal dimerisation domain-containing protein n=2 Tax=Rotaria socialis TaxID=392032 RepID=A0A821RIG9_9BILA|nr:unnamed protein product [Rotaria socialis]